MVLPKFLLVKDTVDLRALIFLKNKVMSIEMLGKHKVFACPEFNVYSFRPIPFFKLLLLLMYIFCFQHIADTILLSFISNFQHLLQFSKEEGICSNITLCFNMSIVWKQKSCACGTVLS